MRAHSAKPLTSLLVLAFGFISIFGGGTAHAVAQDTILNTYSFPGYIPSASAITPDGRYAITQTANTGGNKAFKIDLVSNTVVDTITIGSGGLRTGISPDGKYALILNETNATVSKIDLSNDSVTATISIPSPRGLAIAPDSSYAIVVSDIANTNYYKINLATNAVTTISGVLPQTPVDVSISPDGTKAIFGTWANNIALLVNLTNDTLIRSYAIGANTSMSTWAPDSSSIYMCNQLVSNFYKIDPNSSAFTSNSLGGGCTSIAVSPDNSFILISSGSGSLYRYLTSNLASVAGSISGFSGNAWDVKIGYNSSIGTFAILTDRTNAAVYKIFEYSGQTPATFNFTAAPSVATYRTAYALTVQSNTPGKVTFFANGKKIPGCQALTTVANSATCNWRASLHGTVLITASLAPILSTFGKASTAQTSFPVVLRSSAR